MESPAVNTLGPNPDRREVLALAWLGTLGLATAGAGGIIATMLRPAEEGSGSGPWCHETVLRSPDDWPTAGGAPLRIGCAALLLLNGNQVRGYRVVCTQCGCIVGYKPDLACFICPCCGSFYDMQGIPFRGRAAKPLEGITLRVLIDGETGYRYVKAGELLYLREDRAQTVWAQKTKRRRVAVTR